jgi:hypothetical protein
MYKGTGSTKTGITSFILNNKIVFNGYRSTRGEEEEEGLFFLYILPTGDFWGYHTNMQGKGKTKKFKKNKQTMIPLLCLNHFIVMTYVILLLHVC